MGFWKWGFTLPWAKTRWEVKRFHSQNGDRRVTFYLRRDGKFEYTAEKLSPQTGAKSGFGENQWQDTYQSDAFDGLIDAKADARQGFAWIQEN